MTQPPPLVALMNAGKYGGGFSSLSHFCKYRHSVVYEQQQETGGIVGNVVQRNHPHLRETTLPPVAKRLNTTRRKDDEVKATHGSEVRGAARHYGRVFFTQRNRGLTPSCRGRGLEGEGLQSSSVVGQKLC